MNLVLDLNYLLYKNIYALTKLKTLYGDLPQALLNNFNKFTRLCAFNKVLAVSDTGQSWRKDIYKAYKATRKKDGNIDFDFAFEVFAEFKKHIAETNKAFLFEGDRIEGDDWVNLLIRKSNAQGVGCVTVSADQDFHQRLLYSLDPLFINVQVEDYTTYERVVLPEGYEVFLDRMEAQQASAYDLFTLPDANDPVKLLENMVQYWRVKEVSPAKSLFCKLVRGDKGDNIGSIHQTPQKKKDGTVRWIGIGEATGDKMWAHYQAAQGSDRVAAGTPELTRAIVEALEHVKNVELDAESRASLAERLRENTQLIELHHRHIPQPVLQDMVAKLKHVF
jgi:hypothetical protein